MKKLAVRFKVINGKIQLYDVNGNSIDGKDAYWEGTFICSHYNLTNLEGAPSEVNGDFYCYNNNLTSTIGKPKKIVGGFVSNYKTKIERALDEA
jgi:hypothetical protein